MHRQLYCLVSVMHCKHHDTVRSTNTGWLATLITALTCSHTTKAAYAQFVYVACHMFTGIVNMNACDATEDVVVTQIMLCVVLTT